MDRNKFLSFMSFLESADSELCRETYDELLRIGADDERLTKIIGIALDPSVSRKLDFLRMEYQNKIKPYMDSLWENKFGEPRKKKERPGYFDLLKKETSIMVEAYMRVINDPYAPGGFKEQASKVLDTHWAPLKDGIELLDRKGAFAFDKIQDSKSERVFSKVISEMVAYFKVLYEEVILEERGDTYRVMESAFILSLKVMQCAYPRWCSDLKLEQLRTRYYGGLT